MISRDLSEISGTNTDKVVWWTWLTPEMLTITSEF